MASIANIGQLRADYSAVLILARSSNLRSRAFLRLAELDMALGDYESCRYNLVQSLRESPTPTEQRAALLRLGDLSERYLDQPDAAATIYRQIISEHPGTREATVAALRLRILRDE